MTLLRKTRPVNQANKSVCGANRYFPNCARKGFSAFLVRQVKKVEEKDLPSPCMQHSVSISSSVQKSDSTYSATAVQSPPSELEIFQEKLGEACARINYQKGPVEISFCHSWLAGVTVNLEMHQGLLHCRIKAPAAFQRQRIKTTLSQVVAKLEKSGFHLGTMEVTK